MCLLQQDSYVFPLLTSSVFPRSPEQEGKYDVCTKGELTAPRPYVFPFLALNPFSATIGDLIQKRCLY